MLEQLLKVRIISPNQDLFVGEARSVSSVNSLGNFDVLPQHAKFITLVENHPVVLRFADGKNRQFNFKLAIIHVHQDKVDIYTDPLAAGQKLTEISAS